ncbi:50S ribosomal protein L17 [candidate division WWE3 bacterium RIFCSPHIGHO2_01_FULL_42_13]|uniref:Large ribosomal subunit protein bL17 n=1 Tax=candidate division WWE3 bacterium RIFCSPHIGHO2_01_FULL_42_13 TaxID=1802617 RepID=A0A1F4UQI3_UNCKA|nr:MAG: 50S ribosomal protein L17 [candidate division WWE3 bacterium RIFCSPHIGHO2_01_FULL_42_13]
MRHNVSGKKLGRDTSHRKALLRNLSTSLIETGSIETTLAKAKYVRPYVERLVTKARVGGTNAVRIVRKGLLSEEMVRKLVNEVAPSFNSRPGGYTRIKKLGKRAGDRADMARIEWVVVKETSSVKKRKAKATKVDEKRKTPVEQVDVIEKVAEVDSSRAKAQEKEAKKRPRLQKKIIRTAYE